VSEAEKDVYRRIFHAASEAIFVHDEAGAIVDVNAETCAMFRCTEAQARAMTIGDMSLNEPPYGQADAVRRVGQALREGGCAFEWRSRRRDGEVFWSEVALRRFELEGRPHVIASVRDIDARKRIEEALRESEERFSKIFNATSTMLAFTDPEDGRILDVNESWLATNGLGREQAIGRTGRELGLWTNVEDRARVLAQLKERGRAVDLEVDLKMGGRVVPALVNVEYIDMRGARYILWELRDLSERRRAEKEQEALRAQLIQAQKMESVGQLAGGIAHDFNNILSAILGFTKLATEGLAPEDVRSGYLEQVLRAGERASELTRQLLAFSRKQVMQPKVVDPVPVLRDMEPMLRRLIGEHIVVVMVMPRGIGRIKVDVAHLEQAIMNLAVNARDAMPDGGTLTIEAEAIDVDAAYADRHIELKPGPHVVLAVSDTGTGMDEATRARAFEPFFTTKGPGRGTGLGLSTVYGIVKQSGGAIWLYSEQGRGTTFKLFFPCTAEEAAKSENERPVPSRRGSETVLVVEDDHQLRALVGTVLRGAGYVVVEAANPQKALAAAQQTTGSIHLLLTDVVMPQMNGRQLAEKVAPIHPETRVLYMSGYTENTIVHQGVIDDGILFLPKPITPERLLAMVRKALDAR
jgi:PAS domain S-box-containing protein